MNLGYFRNCFQFYNNFIMTDKISDIFFLKIFSFIFDFQSNFTFIRHARIFKLAF